MQYNELFRKNKKITKFQSVNLEELFRKNKKITKFQSVNLEGVDHVPKLFDIFTNYLTIFVKYTDIF